MATVAVIAEYNPFHLGHAYHLEQIRHTFGEDTTILILLADNYVQRGETALFDQYDRAAAALVGGGDVVLSLPYPYSCSHAERYASAAIYILNSIGCVDYLSFGSECGDLALLQKTAARLYDKVFLDAVLAERQAHKNLGHMAATAKVYREKYGDSLLLSRPNDTLALEYLHALSDTQSHILPHTLLRQGDYHTGEGGFPSASALRTRWESGERVFLSSSMPERAFARLCAAEEMAGHASFERFCQALLPSLLLHPPADPDQYAGCEGGLGSRLCNAARGCDSAAALLEKAATGRYTASRLRRALVHLLLGTTAEQMAQVPAFTRLLAVNKRGQAFLARIRGKSGVPILTKPADAPALPPAGRMQATLADRADSVYAWAFPSPSAVILPRRRTPVCEK